MKKKSKKDNKKDDYEELCHKIIDEARINLGKKPPEAEGKKPEPEKIAEEKERNQKIDVKFGKKDEEFDDSKISPPPTDNIVLESKVFDKIVCDIDKIIEKKSSRAIEGKFKETKKEKVETQVIEGSTPSQYTENYKERVLPKKDNNKSMVSSENIVISGKSETTSELNSELKPPKDSDLRVNKIESKKDDDFIKPSPKITTFPEKSDDRSELDSEVKPSKEFDLKVEHNEPKKEEYRGPPEIDNINRSNSKVKDEKYTPESFLNQKEEIDKEINEAQGFVKHLPASYPREFIEKKQLKKLGFFKKKKKVETKQTLKNTTLSEDINLLHKPKEDIYSSKTSVVKVEQAERSIDEIKSTPKESNIKEKEKYSRDKKIDFDNKAHKPPELTIKPMFRVENLPKKEESVKDEAKLLDDKIKDSLIKKGSSPVKDQAETKAILLAKKHLKERDKADNEEEKKLDILLPVGVPLTEEDIKHEHVFFDEEDSDFKGWTPKVTDKEKEIAMSLTPQEDVEINNQKVIGELELSKELLSTESVKLSDLGFSEVEWEELDFYTLHEPFAYVEILKEKDSLDKCYFLVEVALTEEEENTLAYIKETMASLEINTDELDEKGNDEYLLEKLDHIINEYNLIISDESRKRIYYYISKNSLGLGKIDPLMKDTNIEDISCDGINVPIFLYHRKYGSLKSNVTFNSEEELSSFIFKLAQKCGKYISIAEPMLDATMPDGSRIQMTLSDEITTKGSTFTIRKFRSDPFSPPDLVDFNTMSSEMIAYMWLAVENGINTLFAGGTASGKTTALNALTLFIPRESKIVSIEETREINLPHPNWIPGVSRSGFGAVVADKAVGEIDMYDLMKAALRQRPEYILVGEIRGREAYVLFQAMATGHATYSTVHADSAQSLIHRLEGKPINIPRVMLQSLDIVCLHVITRVKNFRARRCKQIIEIIDIDPTTKEILTNEVFHWDPIEDKFAYSGKSYVLERIRAEKDMSREEMTNELKKRMKVIEWMNKNNNRTFRDVSKLVAQYTEAPDDTLKIIEKDDKE